MKIFKKLKKAAVLALTAIIFTTAFTVTGAQIEAKAATNEVSMYYVDSKDSYRSTSHDIYIKVKNLGYDKKVTVHSSQPYPSTSWSDTSASYYKTLSDGSEIWKATIGNGMYNVYYAIKYEVNGSTYWDNNDGQNYVDYQQVGVNPIKNQRTSWSTTQDFSNYKISARVKNLGYSKVVKVRYTQDNWVTSSEKELAFNYSISEINEEQWQTTLTLDPNKKDQFQYYVYYQVNGQTYYDNNFGTNYNSTF
jgi:hypothetical protein